MYRPFLLPAGLLALLSTLAQAAEPTTPLGPFYNIEKLAQRPPEPPICCLRPLPSSEPTEETLSFEEWKAKQEQALQQQRREEADGSKTRDPSVEANARTDSSSPQQRVQDLSHSVDDPSSLEPPAPPPAHFRVPLTDRFNYASLDCSARVHYSHRSARSSSSLLSSKKDRYMLSPCDTPGEDKFVVIELCEDIRIDTVQLANFEFFSGVFKDFSVSVARTNPADPEAWTPAGTYRAKNIRGIQSFHPPKTLRDFYRFIRIDFHSHYGNEYYCPISLLRVYGLTHLEQWKWEVWESEYQEKLANAATVPSIDATAQVEAEDTVTIVKERPDGSESPEVSVESSSPPSSSLSGIETVDTILSPTKPKESLSSEATLTSSLSEIITSESPVVTNVPKSTGEPSFPVDSQSAVSSESLTDLSSNTSSHSPLPSSSESPTSSQPSSELPGSDTVVSSSSSPGSQSSDPSSSDSIRNPDSTSSVAGSSPQLTTVVPQETRPVPAASASGESIYRTIMTRLSALEQNSTLYLRYVEEQTRSLRDALTRLEEDVGRLEGLSKATTQSFQKIINEMDRQRRRLEREHGELQTRVDFLTDEVILEKRLGIAQLCLLLTVLVFMALTRGSRGEPFIAPASLERRGSFREWGRRHLSSLGSGEWASKLRTGSPTPIPGDFVKSSIPDKKSDKVKFPIRRKHDDGDETPQRSSTTLVAPMPTRGRSITEIRTPHSRHVVTHRPRTPTSASFTVYAGQRLGHSGSNSATISQVATRPRIRRASSHTAPAPVVHSLSMREGIIAAPLSAKKWAKSAHLHEIRKANPKTRHDGASENAVTVATSDVRLERENVHSREDVTNPVVTSPPTDSTAQYLERKHDNLDERLEIYSREPLSASHLQNLARMQDGTEINRLRLGSLNGVPRIIDLDTESESWVDTDNEGSEAGDRSP